jgi:hypothetical protein
MNSFVKPFRKRSRGGRDNCRPYEEVVLKVGKLPSLYQIEKRDGSLLLNLKSGYGG